MFKTGLTFVSALLGVLAAVFFAKRFKKHLHRAGVANFEAMLEAELDKKAAALERAEAHRKKADRHLEKTKPAIEKYNKAATQLEETDHANLAKIARRFNRFMR